MVYKTISTSETTAVAWIYLYQSEVLHFDIIERTCIFMQFHMLC